MNPSQRSLFEFFGNKGEQPPKKKKRKRKRVIADLPKSSIPDFSSSDEESSISKPPSAKRSKPNDSTKHELLQAYKTTEMKSYVRKKTKDTQYKYHKYNPFKNTLTSQTDIPYSYLTDVLKNIGSDNSRLKKQELLGNFFRSIIHISPSNLIYSVYLSISQLSPKFVGIELGIGDGLLTRAISESSGKTNNSVRLMFQKLGDLGVVGEKVCRSQKLMVKPKALSLRSVYEVFRKIALLKGRDSQKEKIGMIKTLLISSKGSETRFIVKSLQGNLRIGLGEETVIVALSHAFGLTRKTEFTLKQCEDTFRQVFCELPTYERIIPAVFKYGIEKLHQHCHISPGIPVKPMLAKPSQEIATIFDRFGDDKFTSEFKYDGERAQIHYVGDGKYQIYSRNMENNTQKYPDLIQIIPNSFDNNVVKNFIIDSEVVAFDRKTNKIKSFQKLSRRGRKNINIKDVTITVCVFPFDIIYFNDKSLLKNTLRERREILRNTFMDVEGKFSLVKSSDAIEEAEVTQFFNQSIELGCEGLILKKLDVDATYEPSKRSFNWLKLKKDYMNGMADTLDLVPIGGYIGKGKRTGVYGGYLLACYDPDTEEFQAICKIGSGFTDDQLKTVNEKMKDIVIESPKSYYSLPSKSVASKVDVWFEAKYVWEVKGADISLSPVYTAAFGLCDNDKGLSLRFPRFLREREDKQPENASPSFLIKEMYLGQKNLS